MTELEFQEIIDVVRSVDVSGRCLWSLLCERSGLSPDEVAHCLKIWHAIEVLPASLGVDDVEILSVDNAVVRLKYKEQVYLLVNDPWSDEALRRLSGSSQSGSRLALSMRSQMDKLCTVKQIEQPQRTKVAEFTGTGVPVVDFVETAVYRAYQDGASDVHFESTRGGMRVKYRLDGVMASGEWLDDINRADEVISRIKVMAQLDITERRRPQDGRIRWTSPASDVIDLRVSIMPSIFGEDAVLRLLDKAQLRHEATTISLDMLGFSREMSSQVRSLATRPHGMLLVTGPTGSGKTTTVYAALSEVNDGLEKIVTIEDPVEYELPGVLQIPVNEQKGLTFATGLRSILRHDPDKILVGEIRDAETAQIAVQSALTGHLVFTTVHANSLLDVLGRFRHFGIEPFALASALNGVVVQRLLRKICPSCFDWRAISQQEADILNLNGLLCPEKLPIAVGCDLCRNSGYRGRFVLAEVHSLNDIVRDMMLTQDSMTAFKSLLYGDGKQRLAYQALEMVAEGRTTIEEVRRVVGLG